MAARQACTGVVPYVSAVSGGQSCVLILCAVYSPMSTTKCADGPLAVFPLSLYTTWLVTSGSSAVLSAVHRNYPACLAGWVNACPACAQPVATRGDFAARGT